MGASICPQRISKTSIQPERLKAAAAKNRTPTASTGGSGREAEPAAAVSGSPSAKHPATVFHPEGSTRWTCASGSTSSRGINPCSFHIRITVLKKPSINAILYRLGWTCCHSTPAGKPVPLLKKKKKKKTKKRKKKRKTLPVWGITAPAAHSAATVWLEIPFELDPAKPSWSERIPTTRACLQVRRKAIR